MRPTPIALGLDDDGQEVTSCVLVPRGRGECATGPAVQRLRPTINESQQQALTVLLAAGSELSSGDWRNAIGAARGCDVSPRTFANWKRVLLEQELVEDVAGKAHHYRPTAAGRATRNERPL